MAEKEISSIDLSFPDPVIEAKGCLKFAVRNCGVEKMRKLISVSCEEQRELKFMCRNGELSPFLVNKALEYRTLVLRAFDWLVEQRAITATRNNFSDGVVSTAMGLDGRPTPHSSENRTLTELPPRG